VQQTKRYVKDLCNSVEISKQNTAKWKIGILDKIEKKNHQNQSSYEGEIPVTSSRSGLKQKNGQFTTSYACEPITRYHVD